VFSLVVASGIRSLLQTSNASAEDGIEKTPNLFLVLLGLLVGYGSSVSGTGGPLLLVPSLLLLNYPVMTAVGLSMAIQIPIAPFATLGHIFHGSIEWILAIPIAIRVSTGILIGAVIAHKISAVVMQRTVAIALLVSGAMMGVSFLT